MKPWLDLGDVIIDRIIEQDGKFMPALDVLPGLTPEVLAANRDWLVPVAMDGDDFFNLTVQSFVVRTPHHTILVDSCIGNDKDRPTRPRWHLKNDNRFMGGLAALGLRVEDIDFVMCTHLHVDHVGWNTKLLDGRWVPTFPNARYVFGATEYAHWAKMYETTKDPLFLDSVLPIVEAKKADLVDYDFSLGDHVTILPTPGHTPGHFAVCLGDEGVISGDLIHVPLQTRYPELSAKFDGDPVMAAATRRGFLEKFCETGTTCCFTHFPGPSAGRVVRWGDGFRCDSYPA
jgi:glyoxylase-like metal-dependent hydrolase (beta-lactamase superfamily II)